jgi:hypothetical protein
MKSFITFLSLGLFIAISGCNAQPARKEVSQSTTPSGIIEVYYFHFDARCTTCRTVEAETKKHVETLYPQMYKDGVIRFVLENLDEESGKKSAEKLGVSGQTVLLVKGSTKINLTNEAFMYAVVKPDKYRDLFRSKIDELAGL